MKYTTLFIIPGACSFGSMLALEVLNKPYQICITNAEIRASEAFRKINPLGRVGTLVDGNYSVYENLAILFYLVDKNPDSRIGLALNSYERIEAYKWLSYFASTVHVAFSQLFYPGNFVDESALVMFKANLLKRLKDILANVDTHLSKTKYFTGGVAPTIVDGQCYGILRWTEKFEILNEFPHIRDFINRMNELPAVKNILNIEQGKVDLVANSSFAGYYTLV